MNVILKWKAVRIVLTAFYLLAGWILFTGTFAASSVIMGSVFSLVVAAVSYRLFIDEQEASRKTLLPRFYLIVLYLLIVLWKVYTSSFKVALSLITGNINPRIVHFRTRLRSDLARTALAGSITLTPGTVTLDLDEDHLIVHWLHAETTHSAHAFRLIAGSFERLLKRIWI